MCICHENAENYSVSSILVYIAVNDSENEKKTNKFGENTRKEPLNLPHIHGFEQINGVYECIAHNLTCENLWL
jgi:hypothetical protein